MAICSSFFLHNSILHTPFHSGVPAVVDFAAMRDAVKKLGGDPAKINPVVPADLVIDHSVQVDVFRRYVCMSMSVSASLYSLPLLLFCLSIPFK